MQGKGLVRFFAIALTAVCIYQLSFTYRAYNVENKVLALSEQVECDGLSADSCAQVRKDFYRRHLDSLDNETVYNLLIRKFTWEDVQDNRLNLGLDLQGGMSVILQVSVEDMLKNLAGPNKDEPEFTGSISAAKSKESAGQDDFIDLFLSSYLEANPNEGSLGYIFGTLDNTDLFPPGMSNDEIATILREEAREAIDRTFQIIKSRIDKFGVAAPNTQRLAATDRILVELPGVDNPTRVRKILQATAKLEFWEAWRIGEPGIYDRFEAADGVYAGMIGLGLTDTTESSDTTLTASADTSIADPDTAVAAVLPDLLEDAPTPPEVIAPADSVVDFSEFETTEGPDFTAFGEDTSSEFGAGQSQTPLLTALNLNTGNQDALVGAAVLGAVATKDTARVKRILREPEVLAEFGDDMLLRWGNKQNENGYWMLYGMKVDDATGQAALTGEVVTDAYQDFGPLSGNAVVQMRMNTSGSETWFKLTKKLQPTTPTTNDGGWVAIVLDDEVYSCPQVQGPIDGGRTQITGQFTVKEAKDLANVLKTGKLPAPAKIVQESQVGPTLGKESVQAGIKSLVAGMILVLIFMIFYYNRSGVIADIVLLMNVFFIFGILAALNATLTLPGIAGIVLTIGMAVDANVIIFERIREEVLKGKGIRLALIDGYKASYSAIIDANVTTLITAAILLYFGLGPVKGFATVLIIGILSSLFTAVLVSRLLFDWLIQKDRKISYGNRLTIRTLSKVNINFLGRRKIAYALSAIVIAAGIFSFVTRGFQLGVDFKGGRSYEVRFDQSFNTQDVRDALVAEFGLPAPIVKEVSLCNRINVTTSYLIDSSGTDIDSIVHTKVWNALKTFYASQPSFEQFKGGDYTEAYTKVEATIADDIQRSSVWATFFALGGIFVYIFIRFRRWQFSIGALAALVHDVLIILAVFSLLAGILPFSMEIDQAFIAALLTVIGYSINDTVVVFDRVREHLNDPKKEPITDKINTAINKTLSRTLMTSVTTLMVILVLLIFGGDVIRGFSFAITLGILVGTYSSVFVATPVMSDLMMRTEARRARKQVKARPQVKAKAQS